MANQGNQGGPSHESQVKGGQHSHEGSGSSKTGSHNPPSREEASKGGQHSHSGSGNK